MMGKKRRKRKTMRQKERWSRERKGEQRKKNKSNKQESKGEKMKNVEVAGGVGKGLGGMMSETEGRSQKRAGLGIIDRTVQAGTNRVLGTLLSDPQTLHILLLSMLTMTS
jgi:hypothetical protein